MTCKECKNDIYNSSIVATLDSVDGKEVISVFVECSDCGSSYYYLSNENY